MILVLGTAPLYSGAASPLGEFTTQATAGETAGFPADSSPRNITTGPDGLLWFVDFDSVSRINADGTVTNFDAVGTFGANPSLNSIVSGPDGNLWFTKFNPPGQIGKITPDGTMTAVTAFAGGNVQDIIVGPDGLLWYTKPFNAGGGVIGKITTDGVFTEYTPPNPAPQPRDMAVGADGEIWYTDDGNFPANVGRILRTTTDGTITPVAESGVTPGFGPGFFASEIALGPDGNIWTVLNSSGGGSAVAQVTPAGVVTEFADPDLGILQDIVSACGSLFITQLLEDESAPAVWRLTTAGAFTEYTAGLTPDIAPIGLTLGPDQDLWITAPGDPSEIVTMGAGCTDVVPSSSTTSTTATSNAVSPRFTG
jgi:streptogramin lyase